MPIYYLKGDATRPVGNGARYIVHVCNDAGGWGAGFVVALSKRWGQPEASYRSWAKSKRLPRCGVFQLGGVQFVSVQSMMLESDGFDTTGVWVVNMVAQHGYAHKLAPGTIPLDYDALETCLARVASEIRLTGSTIHMPRIGCGLAGGTWDKVEPIVKRTCHGLRVFVYDF